MTKQTGLGDKLQLDDSGGTLRDISNDVRNYSLQVNQNLLDVTGLDKSAPEKLPALNDLKVTLSCVFNASTANRSHDVFKVRTGIRTFTLDIGGGTTGNPRLTAEMMIESVNYPRGQDGSLMIEASLALADGTTPAWTTTP